MELIQVNDEGFSRRDRPLPHRKVDSQNPSRHPSNSNTLSSGLRFPTYVLARDKIKYVRGESKLDDPNKCLLCEIAKENPNIQSWEVYRDQRTLVMLNAYPFNTGHLMVAPLEHYEHYEDLPRELLIHLNLMLQRCILLLQKTYAPRGFNIGLNQGKWGGASIPHLHVHIVPRYGIDLNFMEIIGGTRVVVEPLTDTLKTLQSHVEILHLNKPQFP